MRDCCAGSLTRTQGLSYGLPLLSLYFLFGPISILQGIYAKYFGVALTTIAAVLLIARLFDAMSDLLIGYFSDLYCVRRGSRKPFIVVGAILFTISSWFLYVPFGFDPMQSNNSSVSTEYLLAWFLVFYFSYTLFEIPHIAWGSDLASDSQEKNTVYGMRSLFVFLGSLLFFSVPLLPFFETSEFTPQTLRWSVIVAGVVMLPMLYLCIKQVPNRYVSPLVSSQINHSIPKESMRVVLKSVFSNKPLLILNSAHVCTGFGAGMYIALLYVFADAYLDLGEYIAIVYAISFALGMASLKLWLLLANRFGKQNTWMLALILVVAGIVGTGALSPENTGWYELLLCKTLVACGFSAFSMLVPSLLSDIVDYGTWKFGTDRAATYFSLYTFVNKTAGALGTSLGLAIAGWAGFDPAATTHSDSTIKGLSLALVWIPALFAVLSIVCISFIPITARRHEMIRRRLISRRDHADSFMASALDSHIKKDALASSDTAPPLMNT